jgi:hypothetical protein
VGVISNNFKGARENERSENKITHAIIERRIQAWKIGVNEKDRAWVLYLIIWHGTAHVRLYHPTVSLAVDMIPYIVPLPIAKHTT